MELLNGILLVLAGLGIMAFGLFLFYALLPLFYGLFGIGVGYWLGALLTNAAPAEMSLIKLIVAIAIGVFFFLSAYILEPFRRILIGIGLGSLVGGFIASAIGLVGFLGVIVMFFGAVLGALITLAVYDIFIIIASSFGGAGLFMYGLYHIFQSSTLFYIGNIEHGSVIPLIIWLVASAVAIGWQFANMERWVIKPKLS